MCTLILLRRPRHDWPLLLAANRDEMIERPWLPPARHWPGQPGITAGLDRLAGGSWLGLNDAGVVAAVMNRRGTLGPQAGLHSRGELVLKALAYESAAVAAAALGQLDPASFRSFNLVVADRRKAFWLCHRGGARPDGVEVHGIPPGVAMLTADDLNDMRSPRIRNYLPRFRQARPPLPGRADGWRDWIDLLASRSFSSTDGMDSAMTVVTDEGYGTVSSSLLAVPSERRAGIQPVWLFAAGRPDRTVYLPVTDLAQQPA